MFNQIPRSVQDAWGEAATRDFAAWLEDVMEDRTVEKADWLETKTELGSVQARMTATETRVVSLERGWSELKTELREFRRSMEERLDRLSAEMNARFDSVNAEANARFERSSAETNARFERSSAETNARFERSSAETNARFDALNRLIIVQTRWNIGLIGLFCTILALLYALDRFAP